jgi:uncharacterized protein
MAKFVIHVPDIDSEGKQFRFPVEPTWMASVLDATDLRADPDAVGAIDVFAQLSGADVLVTGTVETPIYADCVRCLEETSAVVRADLSSLFTRHESDRRHKADRADDAEEDATDDEPSLESFTGDDIILDDLVREHVILEVPMQPLCREDCPGIAVPEHVRPPADFGETKDAAGVDPRFSGLKEIADAMSRKEE